MDTELLQRASRNDMAALVNLDGEGFLLGPGEDAREYADRLGMMRDREVEIQDALAEEGEYNCEGVRLKQDDRVPHDLLAEPAEWTEQAYRFRIDWVPAFFINPSFSWLFGGCAYYFMPEQYTLMILRRSFQKKAKWLWYDRREILAHEMCHTARVAFGSRVFEERLAYGISHSGFRRRFGGVFQSPIDSLVFLGSTLLLLAMQLVRTFAWPALPIWPFWGLPALVCVFLLVRDRRSETRLRRAQSHVAYLAGEDAPAVVFRCSDTEIEALSELDSEGALRDWVEGNCDRELRWRVIRERFLLM